MRGHIAVRCDNPVLVCQLIDVAGYNGGSEPIVLSFTIFLFCVFLVLCTFAIRYQGTDWK